MRRRELLAGVGAAATGALAGCGYAYGGGDLRGSARVGGGFGDRQFALGADRFACATNGRTYDFEASRFRDGTSLGVFDRGAAELWSHFHGVESRAVALGGETAYLLDDDGGIVAVRGEERPAETDGARAAETTVEGVETWRVRVDAAARPLAADDRGAYVVSGGRVAAVRGGDVAWRADPPGTLRGLAATPAGPLAVTSDALVALAPDGDERWSRDVAATAFAVGGGGATGDGSGDGLVVADVADAAVAFRLSDGERLWDADVVAARALAVRGDRIYARTRGGVVALDAADGSEVWSQAVSLDGRHDARGTDLPTGRSALVPAAEGVYGAAADCEAVGVGPAGVRWRRALEVGDCRPVGGWLDGQRVALLFADGAVRWLQRADQSKGLL